MKLVSLAGLVSTAGASHVYDLTVSMCQSWGCHPTQKRVALDANAKPGHENQVHTTGDTLTLTYDQAVGGPRVYMIEEDGVNENTMFELAGKEFTFDVELSSMTCGFNAAMYFIGMDKNQGGAEDGTHYCDAQAVGGTYCSEMDLFEGNTAAHQITTHACSDACATYSEDSQCKYNPSQNNICDHSGCGMNPFRYGPGSSYDGETNNEGFYGEGSQNLIDTTQKFTVTTQFQTTHIERFYTQNGKTVELPTLYVKAPSDGNHYEPLDGPTITDEYCGLTYDSYPNGPASQMLRNSRNGMVLSMSAWYDQETYNGGSPSGGSSTGMSWLDGINSWGPHLTKTGPCHDTTSDAGSHEAKFSHLKFGDIGTTQYRRPVTTPAPATTPAPPAPPPPPPAPSGPAQCCHGGCGVNCDSGWCAQSRSNCEGACNGQYCAAPAPPPPAPSPGCDCSWVDQWGCHDSDGSFCWNQCCNPHPDCDCSWVDQWGCGVSDGSHCWSVCCDSDVSV